MQEFLGEGANANASLVPSSVNAGVLLHIAVTSRRRSMFEHRIEQGASLEDDNTGQMDLMAFVIQQGRFDVIELLMDSLGIRGTPGYVLYSPSQIPRSAHAVRRRDTVKSIAIPAN